MKTCQESKCDEFRAKMTCKDYLDDPAAQFVDKESNFEELHKKNEEIKKGDCFVVNALVSKEGNDKEKERKKK